MPTGRRRRDMKIGSFSPQPLRGILARSAALDAKHPSSRERDAASPGERGRPYPAGVSAKANSQSAETRGPLSTIRAALVRYLM